MSVLAENVMGNQAVVCNDTTYGVQFHPEFSQEISQAYLRLSDLLNQLADPLFDCVKEFVRVDWISSRIRYVPDR